jgi:hypothetical protein
VQRLLLGVSESSKDELDDLEQADRPAGTSRAPASGAPASARSKRPTALSSIAHRGLVANKAARPLIPWLMIQMMPASTTSPLGPHPEISHQRARKSLLPAADWSDYGCKPAARRTRSASLLMTHTGHLFTRWVASGMAATGINSRGPDPGRENTTFPQAWDIPIFRSCGWK